MKIHVGADDVKGREAVAPGNYQATIGAPEYKEPKEEGKSASLIVPFHIDADQNGDAREIRRYYSLSDKARFFLGRLFAAAGLIEDAENFEGGEIDTDDLEGSRVTVVVDHRESNGNIYADVKDVMPAE